MPEVATPNQGEREFETGTDEFFKAHSELTAANAKRTYDAYQDLDLVLARRSQLQFDQLQNVALQALQNSVETSNMVAKQTETRSIGRRGAWPYPPKRRGYGTRSGRARSGCRRR